MPLYNLPNESLYTITDILTYADNATGGILVTGFLLAIFVIIVMISVAKGYDLPESGVLSSFILGFLETPVNMTSTSS